MEQSEMERIRQRVAELALRFAGAHAERQRRQALDPADFTALAEAGFLRASVPVEDGGAWTDDAHATRPLAEMLRGLARADPSLALVAAMHPAVIVTCGWLNPDPPPAEHAASWERQRRTVFESVLGGAWWGTITSEPGSGGDLARTKAIAERDGGDRYHVTGPKHFGSGSGVTSFMMTTALPNDGEGPEIFYLDVRGTPWDGSAGVTLVSEWDGQGMAATQSHAMRFERYPALLVGHLGHLAHLLERRRGVIPSLFAGVIVGIVDAAMEAARAQLAPKQQDLRPYERVEWSHAEVEEWLIHQAFEGMLRDVEQGRSIDALKGKTALADLAESVTRRLCRIIGGGTFSRRSPFGISAEDVRALGFLRPPWGLAFDALFQASWER